MANRHQVGSRGGRSFVLNVDLAKVVWREAGIAIAFWWGVRPGTVSRWRRALGVGRSTKGSHGLWSANSHQDWAVAARKKAWATAFCADRASPG